MANNSDHKKLIGIRLKQMREKKGFYQEEAAEKLGITRASLSNYETGRAAPPTNILREASSLYHASIDYLLGNSENSDPVDPEAEFLKDIDLSDSAVTQKYNILVDGESVDSNDLKRVLEYLRAEKRLVK